MITKAERLAVYRAIDRAILAYHLDTAVSDELALKRMMYILSGPACQL
jgi:hypothetical protein